jgi:apolipoprotein N-acyltransferase
MPAVLLFLIAGVFSAALAYFGTGLHPIWWPLWLAPIPVVAVASRLRTRRVAFLFGFVVWFVGGLNLWSYLTTGMELPVPLRIVLLAIPALAFALGVLMVRGFLRRGSVVLAALALPVFWVAYEFLTEITSPHSTFGNLAYTQMNCLPIIQIASITGIWGISFLVFLFAVGVGVLLSGVGKTFARGALAATVGVVICVVFLFGEWRLHSESSPLQRVSVALIAKDVPITRYVGPEEQALQLFREYADEVRRVATGGINVVVLPEKIGRLSENNLTRLDSLFSSTAAATNAAIDLGVTRLASAGGFNSSRFYRPGEQPVNYDKHHLVPGVEREKPGNKRVVIDQSTGRWGLQICKDMDFPQLSRQYSAEGANLLLVPAWDFGQDGWLHSRMALLRAVENGFVLARSARNGLLTLSDNRGRVLAEAASAPDRFVSITGTVNVARDRTFYSETGDWFGWVCVALLIVLFVVRWKREKVEITK